MTKTFTVLQIYFAQDAENFPVKQGKILKTYSFQKTFFPQYVPLDIKKADMTTLLKMFLPEIQSFSLNLRKWKIFRFSMKNVSPQTLPLDT